MGPFSLVLALDFYTRTVFVFEYYMVGERNDIKCFKSLFLDRPHDMDVLCLSAI